jgi:8-oxo-dGTP pyrophosphatase MutT (NUDIX family)
MSRDVKPAVKALIEKDGKILVLKTEAQDRTCWVLPGGKVEYDEEPVNTLEREIQEELSTQVDVEDPVGMYHFYVGAGDEGDQVVLTVFEGEIDTQEINISENPVDENITSYEWLTPEELIQKSSNESLHKTDSRLFR